MTTATHIVSRGVSVGLLALVAALALSMAFSPAPSLYAG